MIYLRNRYYDPTTAQFLTRDPLDPITRSAYGYVGDNPLNGSDPSGLVAAPPTDGCSNANSAYYKSHLQKCQNWDPIGHAATWVNKNIQFSAGGCAEVCVSVSYQDGKVSLSGGLGLNAAVPFVGAVYAPGPTPPCGWSQSNGLFGSIGYAGGGYTWSGTGNQEIGNGGAFTAGVGGPKGIGGGFVHNWTWTFTV